VNGYQNIILIGMPNSGKSFLGKSLSENLNIKLIESDDYLPIHESKPLKRDWNLFRMKEEKIIHRYLNDPEKKIISTGGGCIENVHLYSRFLNKSKNDLIIHIIRQPSNESQVVEKILPDDWSRLWNKRAKWYFSVSDYDYWNDGTDKDFLLFFNSEIKANLI
jgi:shikimate kinase